MTRVMRILRAALPFGFAIALTGCVAVSDYTAPHVFTLRGAEAAGAAAERQIADPARAVVLLFNHGSTFDSRPDSCVPAPEALASSTPKVVLDLAGTRIGEHTLYVALLCTAHFTGDTVSGLKVEQRSREIARALGGFAAAGIPPERLFLVGQSAGGWASLMLARRAPDLFNAAIAFAPAFSGERHSRSAVWADHRERLLGQLAGGPMRALIFAFDMDSYERPEDLAPLATLPGVTFAGLPSDRIDGLACDGRRAHTTVFRECFRQTQRGRMVEFIAVRLGAR